MCKKIASCVKSSDLLGVPVTLTHRGQPTYDSVCGGFITLLITVGLSLFIGWQLEVELLQPEFFTLPPAHSSNSTLSFQQNGDSMIAYLVYGGNSTDQSDLNRYLRVTFFEQTNVTTSIPAVYCKDLFAVEIANEKRGDSDDTYFTDAFETTTVLPDVPEGTYDWICPNMTSPVHEFSMALSSCQLTEQINLKSDIYA